MPPQAGGMRPNMEKRPKQSVTRNAPRKSIGRRAAQKIATHSGLQKNSEMRRMRKMTGRTTTADERRGRTLPPGARGAKQTTPHGPLQRLLDGTPSRRHAHKQGKLSEALGNDDGFP